MNLFQIVFIINCIIIKGEANQHKFVIIIETDQTGIEEWLESSINQQQFDTVIIDVNDKNGEPTKLCESLSQDGVVAVIDTTWAGDSDAQNLTNHLNLPYVAIDISISPFLRLLDAYLEIRNSTDVAVIFDSSERVDQALYYWIDTTLLRMVISENLDETSSKRIQNIRPIPNNFVIAATTTNMTKLLKTAFDQNLVELPQRWNLLFLDFEFEQFDRTTIGDLPINLLFLDSEICCKLMKTSPCQCSASFKLQRSFFTSVIEIISETFHKVMKENWQLPTNSHCNTDEENDGKFKYNFETLLQQEIDRNPLIYKDGDTLRLNVDGRIDIGRQTVAHFDSQQGIQITTGQTIPPIKQFYRIGITHAIPWSYKKTDSHGHTYWAGYCPDLAQKLSEVMNFDYEFVEPQKGTFGAKRNGVFDGVIGDLASGETDMAITALTMTADREEFVDFVPPYFERTGITIVMRKPVKKTSLFRFMTVLKLEVWLSIVGALVGTGFLIWFLDKYSPYSARNNKKAYPFPCREFTLKESFWFALTSFTPQGGGEAPKALSGRTLVAAYWLFVVLMLATFTANLAAFLTVERMQTPVQSLEQLSKQSRINYTVVKDSSTHLYFINMKNAEDTLYRMWKELVLNASTDDTRYRVWDYPIREQYGHILIAINDSNPLPNAAEGFRIVNERTDADFAFIHDSSEIKYEITRNCNLTEVGEVFGERPYAIAVQQGSHLQDQISKSIMMLQNDRYFADLKAKHWNNSAKGECPSTDDNEGITLESLGGVFIATLFGLALAMITLVGEVIYYRRKRKIGNAKEVTVKPKDDKKTITIGTEFKPVNYRDKNISELSHITLFPRPRNRITHIN